MSKSGSDAPPIVPLIRNLLQDLAILRFRPQHLFRFDVSEPISLILRRVNKLYAASRAVRDPDHIPKLIADTVTTELAKSERANGMSSGTLLTSLINLACALAENNQLFLQLPAVNPSRKLTLTEESAFRTKLAEIEFRLVNEATFHAHFVSMVASLVAALVDQLPPTLLALGEDTQAFATVPIIALMRDPKSCVTRVIGLVLGGPTPDDEVVADQCLRDTRSQLFDNILTASGITAEQARQHPNKLIVPDRSTLDAVDMASTYCAGTAFLSFFETPVHFDIPKQAWTEHALVLSPPGHGKTQLLQTLIWGLLSQADPPGMFIIDDQDHSRGILNVIQRLDLFHPEDGRLRDRLLIFSPEDLPSLNFFKMGDGEVTPDMLACFIYLFSTLDNELSTNQSTAVRFILRLISKIPKANLQTLLEIMDERVTGAAKSKFFTYIQQLDPIALGFFETHFYSTMKVTKESVSRRLYALLADDTFAKMFSATTNTFDPSECMRQKKIVLINASTPKLGDAATVFARFFISQILAAATRRGQEGDHPLSLLIIDEAAQHFDQQTERILQVARKYELGLIAATQMLDHIPQAVKAAMFAGTRVKFLGPISHSDATVLAREINTTAEFIKAMRKIEKVQADWACYVRNNTPKPVKLTVPFGQMEGAPQMNPDAYAALRAKIRDQVHIHDPPSTIQSPLAATTKPAALATAQPSASPSDTAPDPSKPSEW